MAKPFVKIDWNKEFATAHESSWPRESLSMSLEVYERNKEQVDRTAKKFRYKKALSAPKQICFVREQHVSIPQT